MQLAAVSQPRKIKHKFDHKLAILDLWEELEFGGAAEIPEETLVAESSVACRALMFRTYPALTHKKSPISNTWKSDGLSGKRFLHLAMLLFMTSWVILSDSHSQSTAKTSVGTDVRNDLSLNLANGKAGRAFLQPSSQRYYIFHHSSKSGTFRTVRAATTLLCLKVDQMPMLATLHLDGIFASPKLINFLVGYKFHWRN